MPWKGEKKRRLDAVVARIVRGLFYHETGTPLDPASGVTVYQEAGLRDISADARAHARRLCGILCAQPEHKVGNEVFSYWFQRVEGQAEMSMWLLGFYQKVWFLGMTLPSGMPEA